MEFVLLIIAICVVPMSCFLALHLHERKDKRYVRYGEREFECYCLSELNGKMCGVDIYEIVHPNRKFFRRKHRAYKTFWISDYTTIKDGIYAMIDSYIEDEVKEQMIIQKWKL